MPRQRGTSLLINDAGQWTWRTGQAYVQDMNTHPAGNAPLARTLTNYSSTGDPTDPSGLNGPVAVTHAFGGESRRRTCTTS